MSEHPRLGGQARSTPLVASKRWPGLWWKCEGEHPLGTVERRGAEAAVAAARAAASATRLRYAGPAERCAAVAACAAAAGLELGAMDVQAGVSTADRLLLFFCAGPLAAPGDALPTSYLDQAAWASGVASLALELAEQLPGQALAAVLWAGASTTDRAALQAGFAQGRALGLVAAPAPAVPEIPARDNAEDWTAVWQQALQAEGQVLSQAGARGTAAALPWLAKGQQVVVIDPRSWAREADELARWLGCQALPGRLPVGGIIAPA